jgi:hypothetical protein
VDLWLELKLTFLSPEYEPKYKLYMKHLPVVWHRGLTESWVHCLWITRRSRKTDASLPLPRHNSQILEQKQNTVSVYTLQTPFQDLWSCLTCILMVWLSGQSGKLQGKDYQGCPLFYWQTICLHKSTRCIFMLFI